MRISSVFMALATICSAQFTNTTTGGAGVAPVSTGGNTTTGGAGIAPTNGTATNGTATNGTGGAAVGPVSTTTVFATRTVLLGSVNVFVTVAITAVLPAYAFTTLSQVTVVQPGATVLVLVPVSSGSVVTGVPTVFTATATGAVITAGVATAGSGAGAQGASGAKASTTASALPVVTRLPVGSGADKIAAGALGAFALLAALTL